MTVTKYPHIEIREDGVPWIEGHETKVVEIVLDRIVYNLDAEEIQQQHSYLSLAEIHSALAYYYDHKDEVDADIQRRQKIVDDFFAVPWNSAAQQKLSRIKAERLPRGC